MALGAQLPIRLDGETDRRLQSAAESLGTSKSALIRLLAKTFCDQVIQDDGSIAMPVDWEKLLPRADNRSGKLRKPPEPLASGEPVRGGDAETPPKRRATTPKKPAHPVRGLAKN